MKSTNKPRKETGNQRMPVEKHNEEKLAINGSSSGAVMNALTLSGTIFLVSLGIMVKRNAKDMIWHLKNFKEPDSNGMKI